MKIKDLVNQLNELVYEDYGDYEVFFAFNDDEKFYEFGGYITNSAVIIELEEEKC